MHSHATSMTIILMVVNFLSIVKYTYISWSDINIEILPKPSYIISYVTHIILTKDQKYNLILFSYTIDIDDCNGMPCHHKCHNASGSYQCRCYDGYELDGSDNDDWVCLLTPFLICLWFTTNMVNLITSYVCMHRNSP